MPGPLAPHPDNPNIRKLNFLDKPKVTETPDPGGRPTEPHIIQIEADFSPLTGIGRWDYYCYPQHSSFDDWPTFRRFIRRILLKVEPIEFEHLMDYAHDYKVLNIDLKTNEVYPSIPRPTGYVLYIPESS